ncbi:ATP-binding protein [Hwanghaeella sp. LZ110]|uniref:ATP-binding protein n=1 Tax=Hwanghaeella sp. LZ110 TaxID=3402810 RepID=UPI003B6717B5
MKKLTNIQIDRKERLRRKRQRRNLKRRLLAIAKKFARVDFIKKSHKHVSQNIEIEPNRVSIELPENISLTTNYKETIEFINKLRDFVIVKNMPVMLHFDNVVSVSPAAALVMTAEIYRCRNLRPGRNGVVPVNGNWPEDPRARKILKDMGFYKLMNLPDRAPTEESEEQDLKIHLGFASLNTVNASAIAEFHEKILAGFDVSLSKTDKKKLQGAIIEAIGNATEHAYKSPTDLQSMKKRSWMSGYIDIATNELMFMVMDQGVGIPNTLDPTLVERMISLRRLKPQPTDSDLIGIAATLRRTSTQVSGRGKGIDTMKRLITTVGNGELRIFSNKGLYMFDSSSKESRFEQDGSIGGTLIQWKLKPLKRPTQNGLPDSN